MGLLVCAGMLTACSDSDDSTADLGPLTPAEDYFGQATGNFSAEEWYPGGELGTTEKASYSAITPAAQAAGMRAETLLRAAGLLHHDPVAPGVVAGRRRGQVGSLRRPAIPGIAP